MAFDNDYYVNSRTKVTKKIVLRGITFLVVVFIAIFNVVILFSRKVDKLIAADIRVETVKLQNAIKKFNEKTGSNPNLAGLEDSLQNVKSSDGAYNFGTFYGSDKIYEIPESIKDSRERSNRIVTKKDKKGGWVYDQLKGTISPNI
ncbi:competence protein ComE [Leptotrichia sp. oral taxon 223]|uniref:competence protein ComE n=1 Tax=Leptotrichia sp. oral taxon 223 TaxID=712363 RepID=UPI0015BCA866|nr:competence protein ComE [Leptotrichia sp. oral taxon 223]NWO18084.1 competence protein ComE [Leptotrichia sp. oral taxon 223]